MFSFAGEWKRSFDSMLSLDPAPYLALSQKCQKCNGEAARAERHSLAAGFRQNDMKPCKPAARVGSPAVLPDSLWDISRPSIERGVDQACA